MASLNDIISLLDNLPPGTNQFRAIQILLRTMILPKNDSNFIMQMEIFSGVFAFVVFMFIAALINNLRKGNYWIFRLQGGKSSLMPYIVANGSTSWVIPGVFFFSIFQAYIWLNIQSSQGEVVNIVGYAKALIWASTLICIPSYFTGWTALWSLATSYVLQAVSTSNKNSSSNGKYSFLLSPLLVNSVAVIIPLLAVSTFIPLSLLSASHYNKSMTIYAIIDQELAAGALYLDQGGTFSIASLIGSGTVMIDEFVKEIGQFAYWFKRYNMALAGFSSIIFVLLTTFAFLHIRLLRNIINTSRSITTRIDTTMKGFAKTSVSDVQQAYMSLLIIFGVLDAILVVSIISALRTGLNVSNIDPSFRRFLTLTVVYTFGLPSIPMSILVVQRSLQTVTKNSTTANTNVKVPSRHFPIIELLPTTVTFSGLDDIELGSLKDGRNLGEIV